MQVPPTPTQAEGLAVTLVKKSGGSDATPTASVCSDDSVTSTFEALQAAHRFVVSIASPRLSSGGPVFYAISVRDHLFGTEHVVHRRYNAFETLELTLRCRHARGQHLRLPARPLPPKGFIRNSDMEKLQERAHLLEAWASELLADES